MNKEQTIREAAQVLHRAILEGRKAGLVIAWPSRADDLPRIAISETGKVARPAENPDDGLLQGEPLKLSDEERAALPKLEPLVGDEPMIVGTMKSSRSK